MATLSDLQIRINTLISRKERCFRRIQQCHDIAKAVENNKADFNKLSVRVSDLDSLRESLEKIVDEISALELKNNPNYKIGNQEVHAVDDLYFEIMRIFQNFQSISKPSNQENKKESERGAQPRLPKIELVHFDGKLENWITFRDTFSSLIHTNTTIGDIEKFYYLLSVVTGPALQIVKSLPVSKDNYNIVWTSLCDRYENKRAIATRYMDKLFAFKPLPNESVIGLNSFLETFQECVQALELLGIDNLAGFILCYIGLRNLDQVSRREFEQKIGTNEIPVIKTLIEFVTNQTRMLEMSTSANIFSKPGTSKTFNSSIQNKTSKPTTKNTNIKTCLSSSTNPDKSDNTKRGCLYCNKPFHSIYKCFEYIALTPAQRIGKIKALHLCENCLRQGHASNECPSKITCTVCKNKHHHTLHIDPKINLVSSSINNSCNDNFINNDGNQVSLTCSTGSTVMLGTAIIHVLDVLGKYQAVRVVVDSGSQSSFMTNDCAQRLGLPRQKCNTQLTGLGGTVVRDYGMVLCKIKPTTSDNPIINLRTIIVSKISGYMPSVTFSEELKLEYKNLVLADPTFYRSSRIDMLLGSDLFPIVYDGGKYHPSKQGLPLALSSIFGYIITGQLTWDNSSSAKNISMCMLTSETKVDDLIKSFWETESLTFDLPKNPDDVIAEHMFVNDHKRDSTGRYIVKYPFKPDAELGDSKQIAIKRFQNLERKLSRLPDLREQYKKFMDEYASLGHMRCVGEISEVESRYIIPHHCVHKPDSSSTRLRVVFDASCQTSNNKSLNSVLYTGPKLQADLVELLIRFRLREISLCGDISKMYRCILIDESQHKYQHVLWRGSPSEPLKVYELCTVTYGVASSPFLAIRTLQQLAADEGARFPDASRALREGFYVDDLIWSVDSAEEALKIQRDLVELLRLGGFELRKWSSNSDQVLKELPSDQLEPPVQFDDGKTMSIKILGLHWIPKEDSFSFRTTQMESNITKRSVLSQIAKLFDPLGFVNPCIFLAKMFMQKLWCAQLGWDDILPKSLLDEWSMFQTQIPLLSKLKHDRHVFVRNHTVCQVVGFCDASTAGFAAVVYIRSQDGQGNVNVSLLLSKSKVAPLKTVSIPRLELMAAHLLSKTLRYVTTVLAKEILISEVLAFTDSSVTLTWINTPAFKLKTFVANRVAKITESSSDVRWFHVNGTDNPADVCSRGAMPADLSLIADRWFRGPRWLYEPQDTWPVRTIQEFQGEPLELKCTKVQSPVLVVELSLNRLEGTQLRALGLLSVFGFNMTYAVRAPTDAPGPTSCSAIECRLLGNCYARHDYQEFYCACFEGYSGADCGEGPLCPRTSNMCKNGGTCRQMGPAAVSCICAPGYTGDLCESQVAEPECGVEECSDGCADAACDCSPRDTDFTSARFETRLQIGDQANTNISQEIVKQITSYLKASNITLEDDIEVLNISLPDVNNARTVWLRLWGARRDAGTLRAALARLAATRARSDRLRILPATQHFYMVPALSLQAVVVNQRPEVWEGSEFILSCMAYGSPDIVFTWYKDGVKVNFNGTTRDIWTRTVAEDALGRRMSVLGISEAKRPDSGKWSCVAEDAGRRRCRALRLAILRPPDIRLVPSTLTVNKGDNVSITCLAGAGRVHGALGFSWARERTLLPLAPGREVWEDLYPAGSVLKLYNVQKSGEFRCQVSSVAGTNAKGVTMWALGATDEACEAETSHGLRWPKTAPGAHASAACPPGHTGETTRFCEPKAGQHGVKWMLPDFSGCIADSLRDVYEQFSRIWYGYSWANVSHVARQYGALLHALPPHPGEGSMPLQHSRHMLHYLLSSAARHKDREESTEHLLRIYDTLLKHPDTFLDEEKIYDLQNAVADSASMRYHLDLRLHEFTVKTKPVRDDNAAHFDLLPGSGSEEWQLASVGVELVGRTGNASVVAIQYHNLAARLPSLRRSIEFNVPSSRTGREMEYVIASPQLQVAARGAGVDAALHTVTILFTHIKNYSAVASKLACGLRTSSEPRSWSTKACEVRVPEPSHVACRCRGLGTYALFTIARSTLTDVEKDLRGVVKITASVGGAMCLAAAALQLLGLVPGRKPRLPVLLKAATAGTHSAAILALLECDTRQEEACPGTLGWVCAACWCAGCAALCAQPLLLQAELAGRTQRAPSVGLLAGVCTLAWLSARLWGGAPLQLGAAAAAVCAAGCALLAALCLALALCAAARLRTITHKVPPERRNYLKDRSRVVRHTLVLLVTTCAAQAAGVAYAQPGERRVAHVAALSAAALANGVAMLVCYVLRDEECLRSARRVLSLPHRDWHDPRAGDTSLSLYIKQGGEVESRGGVGTVESSSSPVSPVSSYWRAPGLESPARIHRRQSTSDSRADIVRCVEYKESMLSPGHYSARALGAGRAVCDLIPRAPAHPDYMARVCLELGVLATPPPDAPAPLLTCSVDFEPYSEKHIEPKEPCTICVQSNPDVSKIPSPPIKSCLKKSKNQDFSSSTSLPSIEVLKDEAKKSDIEQVNREWNKAYDSPDTDKMLNKISSDLDFLLNRTQNSKSVILDQIEEAPT